jgi:nitroimidazol reductase NimA-like FMN-containing flavoprotein (pyridoxamine 5'-phosphate oxidase superfamily)
MAATTPTASSTSTSAPTERTTLKRLPDRGRHDLDTIGEILDHALICHLGFVVDGQPFVIPTICARLGDTVYVHGSPASRMLRTLKQGVDVCLTVSVIDGLVVARSSFHHSLNYRSVVVLGRARPVEDPAEKRRAVEAITNHVLPGRYAEAREPNDKELRGTSVLALPLDEASAKVRTGPPGDEPDDYALPIWAGLVPITTTYGAPVADPPLPDGIEVPASVARLTATA